MSPPETLRPGVSWLINRLDELRDSGIGTYDVDATLLIPTQSPGILSILGEQGVGKSTTLKYVCDHIATDSERLMTPVVSPERFADGDTLFGWVLAALSDQVPKYVPKANEQKITSAGRDLTLPQLADLVRRQEALARSTYQDASAMVSANPDEWAEGIAAVTTAGHHLVRGWVDLLNGLAPHVTQVVVPVDDTDQVPGLLASVLRDLRWLTLHPLVAVVVCANEEMLLPTLARGPELRRLEKTARTRLAFGALTKAMPHHLRHSVPSVGVAQRLTFIPPGESETLIDMLKSFHLEEPPAIGPASLGDLFELCLGDTVVPSPYVDILPETPRQLDQLWRELRGISMGPDTAEATKTARAAECLVTRSLRRATERQPDLPQDTVRFFTVAPHGVSVQFNFSEVTTGSTIGAGITAVSDVDRLITMRRIDGFHMRLRSEEGQPRPGDLPPAFTNANFLALDLSDPDDLGIPPLFLWGYVVQTSLPGGVNWHGSIDVRHKGKSTDSLYTPLPNWESRYDYYLYTTTWNSIFTLIRTIEQKFGSPLLEWLLLKHMLIISEIQANRAISTELRGTASHQLRDLETNWSADADFQRLEEMLDLLYSGETGASMRQRDFDWWIEVFLPWSADDMLRLPDFATRLLDLRQRLLEKRGRLEIANEHCAQDLRTRIEANLSEEWIVSAIDLLQRLKPEYAEAMAGLHEVAREGHDSEMETFAATLEQRGVPREVIDQMFLTGVTAELSSQLRVAGLPGPAIDALARRFNPIDVEHSSRPITERLEDDYHDR